MANKTKTRIYLVDMKNKKQFLVEAASVEGAVKRALGHQVKGVTIPTPLETLRLQADGATLLTDAAPAQAEGSGAE
jgi:hypothetical protein